MLKLGIPVSRAQLEKAFMAHYEKNPARAMRALNKAKEEAEQKKARYAQIKKAVNRVFGELDREFPDEFRWMIRKALSPCFSIGETVAYVSRGGAMRKAIIASMGDEGAFLIDSGIGRAVPGAQIHKLKK